MRSIILSTSVITLLLITLASAVPVHQGNFNDLDEEFGFEPNAEDVEFEPNDISVSDKDWTRLPPILEAVSSAILSYKDGNKDGNKDDKVIP
jgi:hypothetical protein